jgi:hypothetical protein
MKENTKIRYIGPKSNLTQNGIYTVKKLCLGKFGKEWRDCVVLKEHPIDKASNKSLAFDAKLFRELKPSINKKNKKRPNVDDVYTGTNFWILNNLN